MYPAGCRTGSGRYNSRYVLIRYMRYARRARKLEGKAQLGAGIEGFRDGGSQPRGEDGIGAFLRSVAWLTPPVLSTCTHGYP